jgi:glyoxylase-like metal-dependent hydrolase (beta-lactamase superfamily II)
MRVHHLDCCTMCPLAGKMINAQGRMVAHCLLIETDAHGLVLVDSGIGLDDVAAPTQRLGRPFVALVGLDPKPQHTAVRQIEALGFKREDVRHIVVTHLDLDHAGGLPDFPDAIVHVHAEEHQAAVVARAFMDAGRYKDCHWAHGPKFRPYHALAGESWFGFDRARQLDGLPPEIIAVPLHGHTRGHVCVGVQQGDKWLLHAGDAYFHEGVVHEGKEKPRRGALMFERAVAWNYARVLDNHRRLRELARRPEVNVFSAHDPFEFERLAR